MPLGLNLHLKREKKVIGPYKLGKTIGKGHFSKVKHAVHASTHEDYAVKVVDRTQIAKESLEAQQRREIAILKLLHHPNIVRMHDVMEDEHYIYLVMEYAPGGELFDLIVEEKKFEESVARSYFHQIIAAIEYCHSQGIAHRDLKPENCLLDQNGVLKISDFGLSALSAGVRGESLLKTACGTPQYVAPEVLRRRGYLGFPADIWSCGVILYVMLAGYLPFDDDSRDELFEKIKAGKFSNPKGISPEAKHLIRRMLTMDPGERATIQEIKEDPWFREGYVDTMPHAPIQPSDLDVDGAVIRVTNAVTLWSNPSSPSMGTRSLESLDENSSVHGSSRACSRAESPTNELLGGSHSHCHSLETSPQQDHAHSSEWRWDTAAHHSNATSGAGSGSISAIWNPHESHEEVPMTAFDLISLGMLSLQHRLVSDPGELAPKDTHFMAKGTPNEVVVQMCEIMRQSNMNPDVKPKRPHTIKCFVPQKDHTAVCFRVDVLPLVGNQCSLVEFTRGGWNILQFNTFFKEILPLFAEIQAAPSPQGPHDKLILPIESE